MEWENPFRSDDPYIVGLVFGTVGASMAGAYCLLELFGLSRTKTSLLYFLLVGAWCAFLVVCGRGALEAGELLYHGAIVSALSSVGVWLLCMKKMSPWCVRGISAAGTLILLMYAFVMCRFY
ncbi:MAG: hypothetical protein JXB10_14590 [Pirellulales bacterium]|nr:hypothetical protein [Pirellulales bacterium]